MNNLLEKLQDAIDDAIGESGRINEIVAEMKKCGYDLCLMLESSIAVSPVEQTKAADPVPEPRLTSTGEMELTDEDFQFLQELNISAR